METIREYIDKMEKMHKVLLYYIEDEDNKKDSFDKLKHQLYDQKVRENKFKLKTFLYLISKIANEHYRSIDFFTKIENVMKIFKDDFKKYFTNSEIFSIFENNKRILYFLFSENILIPDKSISQMLTSSKYRKRFYPHYFFNEFEKIFDKNFIDEIKPEIPSIITSNKVSFNIKRKLGENDNYICEIIQNDSINEFTSFVEEKKLNLNSTIEKSIFETNPFLLNRNPTLIEYSAFFGSIRILKYLFQNGVDLTSSLWCYAIHSKSFELIHFLEENQVNPPENDYEECYIKSCKCHNVKLSDYIKMNFIKINERKSDSLLTKILKYFDFVDFKKNSYANSNTQISLIFANFCKYDYSAIVDLLSKNHVIDINTKVIQKKYKFQWCFKNLYFE